MHDNRMRNVRVYIDTEFSKGSELELPAGAARHVAQVLRRRPGDSITLFNGRGASVAADILTAVRDQVRVTVTTDAELQAPPRLRITLLHGLCRGSRMDSVIEKATELGVDTIRPVFTERGVVKLDAAKASKRLDHWRAITVSACEQSGRDYLPTVCLPVTLQAALEAQGAGRCRIVLQPGAERTLGDALAQDRPVDLLTGPEGGFSSTELAAAADAGFTPAALGPRVMRTETAPVVALGVLQYLAGDLGR